MLKVDLEEYGSWIGKVDSEALDDLATLAGDRLTLSRRLGGEVEIKATAHVGVLVTRSATVRIRPKIPLENLFYLLGVGDDAWQVDPAHASYATVNDDLMTAVVRLFCLEVERLTGRGLLHGYVDQEEHLLALRGRVDLGAVMRRSWQRSPVPCQFDEFVPDIWVNRVLLAALSRIRRAAGMPAPLRGEIHLLTQRFEAVTPQDIDPASIDRWRPGRNDRRYQIAIGLAAVILRDLSLADRDGVGRAASFTIDMNKLFEDFVGRELARRLPPALQLAEQYPTHLDTKGRLAIWPDYVVHPTGRPHDPLYVADAKYKLTAERGKIDDHYQLLAYATIFGLEEGTLIYCQHPDAVVKGDALGSPVSSVIVRGANITHYVYRLDLSGSRSDIAARLDALALWLLARIERASEIAHDPAKLTELEGAAR